MHVEDCVFSHNLLGRKGGQTYYGGAIYAENAVTAIDGSLFETNRCVTDYYSARGGALCFQGGTAKVRNSRFEGNYVKQQNNYTQNYPLAVGGRRVFVGTIFANQMSELEVSDCAFEGGYAGYYAETLSDKAGGVLFLANTPKAVMTRCSVYRAGYRMADAQDGVARGDDKGSITAYNSTLGMTNVVMSRGKGNAVETIGATARVEMENCTIAGYTGEAIAGSSWSEYTGYGLYQEDGVIEAHNTIIGGNKNGDYAYLNAVAMPVNQYRYCLTQSEKTGANDVGNIFGVDPLFVDMQYCHLNSRKGVYLGGWFDGGEWGIGRIGSSKAIDAGDPASDVGEEPKPAVRVNMGAYGGTDVASKSMRGTRTYFLVR